VTTKSIHIIADPAHPEGGHAVIRIDGVWLLHARATFRIEPLDNSIDAEDLRDWPRGDQVPLDVRTTARGIELVVGPAVVDAIDLNPGAAVRVSVPAAQILAAKAVWPDVRTSGTKPRAAKLAANGSARDARKPNGLARLQDPRSHSARHAGWNKAMAADAGERVTPGKPSDAAAGEEGVPQRSASRDLQPGRQSTDIALHRETPSTSLLSRLSPMTAFTAGLIATSVVLIVALFNVAPETTARKEPSLSEIFRVGDTSPRGIDARSFNRDDAILLANQFVHGIERSPDTEEGAFWLRKALSLKLSNEQMTWALTQLGTMYATAAPAEAAGNTPDYQSARLLWEMAGANGDPISLCFVGRLYEYGLGVAPNPSTARANYERAQTLGGCPQLDAALARVGK